MARSWINVLQRSGESLGCSRLLRRANAYFIKPRHARRESLVTVIRRDERSSPPNWPQINLSRTTGLNYRFLRPAGAHQGVSCRSVSSSKLFLMFVVVAQLVPSFLPSDLRCSLTDRFIPRPWILVRIPELSWLFDPRIANCVISLSFSNLQRSNLRSSGFSKLQRSRNEEIREGPRTQNFSSVRKINVLDEWEALSERSS